MMITGLSGALFCY